MSKTQAKADLKKLVRERGSIPSQQFLVNRWGVSKSTVSKWLTQWSPIFARETVGKFTEVRAAA